MTILHLISSEGYYGAEAVVVSLARNSARLGCEVVIGVFGDSRGPHTEIAEQARRVGLAVEVVPVDGRWDWKVIGRLRKLAESGIDILHAHGYKADFYACLAAWPNRFATISTCHNWPNRRRLMQFYGSLDRLLLRRFGKAVAVSDSVAAVLRRSGLTRQKITTIPNGVDMELFNDAKPALRFQSGWECKPIVGFVGRLVECKGGPVFLRAAQMVLQDHPDVLFAVTGDGPLRDAWETLAVRLGIAGKVAFLGARRDMPAIYSSLDMLVLPSLDEATPVCILEAQACGKAVIATRVGGVPSLIVPGITGILVEPNDAHGLAEAIARLLEEPELARRLGENGRLHIAEHYSAEGMAARYLEQYREILAKRQRGEPRLAHSAGKI
ncbi:MAG TPA: glycosyltransferase [Bryobacteraceae bacterium]|nr:glycosyltransferase [Bryobacteraceae bacterium]